ncbi:GNAT family N-acetyltransferase [Lactobacillus sp. ESL0681]|uniref:GNAT family N-acetyltransferase n=1 Tax=Lactobacillus sp. ESL0681 TaxID=2983211 RepID=UPI0023F779C5|nr:GNAT family N-acetyltransferase [Lactobacillus sp. ESL0681]WEV40867.1 GNAT family N-acetyltransferase [Lactobacillus sp. ESL0681]
MKLVNKVTLSECEQAAAGQLIKQIHEADQTYSDPYLSNQYNYFPDMPTFVLAYEADQLVGLVMIYADEEPDSEVDLHVEVAPEFRKQGIAKRLLEQTYQILAKYRYSDYNFVSEMSFLQKNPAFLTKNALEIVDREYHMRTLKPTEIAISDKLVDSLTIKTMSESDIEQVALMHSAAFNESFSTSMQYIRQSLADESCLSFNLIYQKEIVGYCCVDLGDYAYFFGLCVAPAYRGQGFATFMIKQAMSLLQVKGVQEFVLDVDRDNLPAICAYQNAGFEIKTEVAYLKELKHE